MSLTTADFRRCARRLVDYEARARMERYWTNTVDVECDAECSGPKCYGREAYRSALTSDIDYYNTKIEKVLVSSHRWSYAFHRGFTSWQTCRELPARRSEASSRTTRRQNPKQLSERPNNSGEIFICTFRIAVRGSSVTKQWEIISTPLQRNQTQSNKLHSTPLHSNAI